MATYTIILTADQDAALAMLITRTNAERTKQNPPLLAITAADYIQARATEVAESYRLSLAAEDEAAVMAAYKTADATKRGQVKITLGVN